METDKLILKFIWKCKASGKAKTILKKEDRDDGLTSPNFKTYHEATVSEIVWSQHKD